MPHRHPGKCPVAGPGNSPDAIEGALSDGCSMASDGVVRISRGLGHRSGERDLRLPPGQYDTGPTWPVLTAEPTPTIDLATWTFAVSGLVEAPTTWSWDEIHALPQSTYEGAIHCVTAWSKFDMTWAGVSVDEILACARPQPTATHALAVSHTGYTNEPPAR
jgi:DMSO/TMAO reductase YedYZ molybdopterin-dependent catalytic subunit